MSKWLRFAVALSVLPPAGNAVAQQSGRGAVEEIVVRARKREELLVDTPISVTAISAAGLRDAGVARLDEIQEMVPNLQFSVGRENQEGFIRLRGVGTTSGEIVFDPGVAVYVDGVFLPRMIGQLVDVIDIEQVEVLRGPQGTLFGKNSVGGAINLTTIKPQPELGASGLVRVGNFDTARTRATLNVPLVEDRLLSRFSFATYQTGGFARNELLGVDVSDQNAMTFLGSLRLLLNDDTTIDLSGTWGRSHGHGRGGQCRVGNPRGLGPSLYPGFADACNDTKPFSFRGNARGLSDTTSYGTWGTIAWSPSNLVTVKSITSWREQRPGHRSDSDFTEFPVLSLAFTGAREDEPTWSQRQISQEVQTNLSLLEDRLSIVSGLFSFWERGRAPTRISSLSSTEDISGIDVETLSVTTTRNWTWAIYGQVVADVTEWLSLTGGLRYTQDKKGATLQITDFMPDPITITPLAAGAKVFDAWTPTVSVALTAPDEVLDAGRFDHLLAYFTWSQGFRGGGFNALINIQEGGGDSLSSFDPETLDNFEIGVKTIAFDNRASLNLAFFRSEYDNIQVVTQRAVGDFGGQIDPDNPPNVQQLTLNAAEATVEGIEAEFVVTPLTDLRLTGSIGLLNTRYDDFGKKCDRLTGIGCAVSDLEISPNNFIDRSGQGFNVTPDLTTSLNVRYAIPVELGSWDALWGALTPSFTWSYQSRMHVLGPELAPGVQEGFHLFNARLGYELWDDGAEIAIWGRNLSDEEYFDRAETVAVLGYMSRYFQNPRTWGGEVRLEF